MTTYKVIVTTATSTQEMTFVTKRSVYKFMYLAYMADPKSKVRAYKEII